MKDELKCKKCNVNVNYQRNVTETSIAYADGTIGKVIDQDPNDFYQLVCENGCVYASHNNVFKGIVVE